MRYVWRLEPDALFSGRMDELVALTRGNDADVLLSQTHTEVENRLTYPHFARNSKLLHGVPQSKRVYALVCVGRFSSSFLDEMASRWSVKAR